MSCVLVVSAFNDSLSHPQANLSSAFDPCVESRFECIWQTNTESKQVLVANGICDAF